MKVKRILSLIIGIMMVCSIVLSSCSKKTTEKEETTTQTGTETTTNASSESEATTEAVVDNAPVYGGTLRISTGQTITVLGYPAEVTNNGPLPYLDPVLQSLLRFDETGGMIPSLSESWETDATTKSITFNLRKGVQFHDGTDFNAEAVKWNIGKYIEAARNETTNIDTMDVVDESTIKITLKSWDSSAVQAIGFFIRYISPTAFDKNGKDWCIENPVGTGPFVLDKWEQNVSISFKRNDNYWEEGKPYLDAIEMPIIQDPMTAASSFKAGELDGLQMGNIDIATELIVSEEYDVVLHKNGIGATSTGLIPDAVTEGSPFADLKVRQALCYAIDAESLAEVFGNGFYVTTNQWGPSGVITYNPEVVGYPYNTQKAKELLAEAGYPDGFDTKLFIVAAMQDMFTAIQAQLADAGIRAEIVLVDGAKITDMYFNTWEGGLMPHWASVQPDLGLYMWRHLNPDGAFYAKGILHPDDVVELLKENQQAANDEIKKETSMKIQKLVYDEYCLVGKPLFIPMGIFIKNKNLHDDGFDVTHASTWTPESAWIK